MLVPSSPTSVQLVVQSEETVLVAFQPPATDGGSGISAYAVDWDPNPGVQEVQTITTSTFTGPNQVETITTSAQDIDAVQVVTTTATPVQEVQVITTSAAPGQTLGGGFTLQLDTTSSGGSIQLSGVIGYTAGETGDRSCVKEILGAMANIGATGITGVTRSVADAQGGYSWSVTFAAAMGNVPQLSVASSALIGAGADVKVTTPTQGNVIADGYFTLTFGGSTTANIAYNAAAAAVQTALQALPTVDTVSVTRSGPDNQQGYAWSITFLSNMNAGDLPTMTTASRFSAIGAVSSVATTVRGNQLGGTFKLLYNGSPTAALPAAATVTEMQTALQALGTGSLDVTRSGPDYQGGYTWTVSFLSLAGALSAFTAQATDLTETRSDGLSSKAIDIAITREGTVQTIQSLASSTTGSNVATSTMFRLQFVYNGATTTTGPIPANPMGDGTCLPTHTEVQQITTSTIDTTAAGGDNVVSSLTSFQLAFTSNAGATLLSNPIFANANTGDCAVGATSITSELQRLTGAPIVVSSVAQLATQACQWQVTFTNMPGNLAPLAVVVNGQAPLSSATLGDDTVAVTTIRDGTIQIIQTELQKLANIGSVTVTATAGAKQTCTWQITFNTNAGNLPLLNVGTSGVYAATATAGTDTLTVASVQLGTSSILGGSFSLQFKGQSTGYLPYDIDAPGMKNALELLSTIHGVNVVRSNMDPNKGYTWTISFLYDLGNLPMITSDFASLTGTVPTVTVAQAVQGVAPPFNSKTLRMPPQSPQNVSVTIIDQETLQMTLYPPLSDGGVPIDAYQVDWDTAQIVDEVQAITLNVPVVNAVQTITTSATVVNEVQLVRLASTYTGPAAVEVQRVNCDASGGSFTLTFMGLTTAPIAASETSTANIKATLQELTTVTLVSVAFLGGQTTACAPCPITGCTGGFTVTFTTVQNAAGDLPPMTGNTFALTGNRRIDVLEVTQGQAMPGGSFKLLYLRGMQSTTVQLPATATAAAVQSALQALDSAITITVTDGSAALPAGSTARGELLWRVTFQGSGSVPALQWADKMLTGNGASIVVYTNGATIGSVPQSVSGNQLGGTFTLGFMGHVTAPIPFDASDTTLQASVTALPNIGSVRVVRTGPTLQNGYMWSVTFTSNPGSFPYGAGAMPLFVARTTGLTGAGVQAVVATGTVGSTPVSGTFNLCYLGLCTINMSPYVTALELQTALQNVASIGRVAVTRTQTPNGFTWLVSFNGCRLLPDLITSVCNTGNLVPLVPQFAGTLFGGVANNAAVTVAEVVAGRGPASSRVSTNLSGGPPYQMLLSGLTTGTPYYTRVSFRNSVSQGYRAYPTPPQVTPQSTQPGAPEPVQLVSSTATTMTVQWALPTMNGGSPVTGYELWLSDWQGSNRRVYDGRNSLTKQYTLSTVTDNLIESGHQYTLIVRAITYCQPTDATVACYGPFSPPASYTVRSPVVPIAPEAPTLDSRTSINTAAANDGIIYINWRPPTDNGGSPITDYQVYMDAGNNNFVLQTLQNTFPYGYSMFVPALTEGNTYRFAVRAVNAIGTSAMSPALTVVMANTPMAPAAPVVLDVASSYISLSWSPPTQCTSNPTSCNGSPLTGYLLWQFSGVNSALLSSPTPVVSEIQQIAITVPTPATEVQSFTITGATGSFMLYINSKYTAPMPYNAGNAALQSEIQGTGIGSVVVTQATVTGGITWTVSYTGVSGPVTLLALNPNQLVNANANTPYAYSVTRVTRGTTVAGGDFTVRFNGYATPHLPYNIDAAEMTRHLQNLPSISHVNVALTTGANGARAWTVTFLTELGNLPPMTVTTGRLTGGATSAVVTTLQDGTPGQIIYDGSQAPSNTSFVARNLQMDTSYAFQVLALNAAGKSIASPSTASIEARGGASALTTTAMGSALSHGIAGVVYEVQTVTTASLAAGTFTLTLGTQTPTGNIGVATTAYALAQLLTVPSVGLGTVHVTKQSLVGSADVVWFITFRSLLGNVPSLVSSNPQAVVAEYIRGVANQFAILPRKASGQIVTDIDAASGFAGADTFFTELWSSPSSVLDGTHSWVNDGGVATYNPSILEVQSITITATTGLFSVALDTSSARLGGVAATSTVILNAATLAAATDVNAAFAFKGCVEGLANVATVVVSRVTNSAASWTYTVTFVANLGPLPLLHLSSTDAAFTGAQGAAMVFTEVTQGRTEVQTITASGDVAFVSEVQSLTTWLDATGAVTTIGGTFNVAFMGSPSVQISVSASAAAMTTALQSLTNLGTVTVTTASADANGSSGLITWFITFTGLVGNVQALQVTSMALTGTSATVYVNEVVRGTSPLTGSFVVNFGGATTPNIPYAASASVMKTALEAMPTIHEVDVQVANVGTGFRWTISFTKNLGSLPLLQAFPIQYQIQRVQTLGGVPTPLHGNFTLTFNGQTTTLIPFDATAAALRAALQALPSVGLVDVTRSNLLTPGGQYSWDVTFRTELGENSLLVADTSPLLGSFASVSVLKMQAGSKQALTGNNPKLLVEKKTAGRPSYTGMYKPATPSTYSLAVLQLLRGGWQAWYYDNYWLQDVPVAVQIDRNVQFAWGQAPITPFGQDYVSVRWWGKLLPPHTDMYLFSLQASHGVRLWLNHSLVLDTWATESTPTSATVPFTLSANVYCDIRLEYHKATGSAYINLQWSSTYLPLQVIDTSMLYYPSHILGSPYSVDILPGATDYPYTMATGPGLSATSAGAIASFVIQAKDQLGNNKTVGGDVFDVALIGASSTLAPTAPPSYLGSGQYQVQYKALLSGSYQLSITIGGTDIYCGLGHANKCSPFTVVVAPGKTVPYTSTATGFSPPRMDSLSEMVAGQASNFSIQAKDTYGNFQSLGGDAFETKAILVADTTVRYRSSVLSYLSGGKYSVQMSIPRAGTYTLQTFFQGSPILMCPGGTCNAIGIPSSLVVVHNVLHPPSSYARDVGTNGLSLATSAIPTGFSIHAMDAFGNLRVGATTAHSGSTGDGVSDAFLVTMTPTDPTAPDAETIVTSSAVQRITASSTQAGSFKLTYGSFTTSLCTGCATTLTGTTLTVTTNLVGLLSVDTLITVGSCVLTTTAVAAGSITVAGNHGCAALTGATSSIFVALGTPRLTALLPSTISAIGMKTALELLSPGNKVSVTLTTDGSGHNVWSITFLSALASWSTAKLAVQYPAAPNSLYQQPLVVSTLASAGVYPVSYTMTVAGVYSMSILADGVPIMGSPFELTVSNAVVDGTSSVAAGGNWYARPLPSSATSIVAIETLPSVAGTPFTFQIQAKDARRQEVQAIRLQAVVVANVPAVQQVSVTTTPFTLSFRGSPTVSVAAGTSWSALASSLGDLATIGIGGVTITSADGASVANGQAFQVTFTNVPGPVPYLVPGAGAIVSELTQGVTSTRAEIQTLTCTAANLGTAGDFTVGFGAATTTVSASSTLTAFQTALSTLVGSMITVTSESSSVTTVCATAANRVFIQFTEAVGYQPALTYAPVGGATMTITSEKDTGEGVSNGVRGILPVWGTYTLSIAGEVTPPLAFNAGASIVQSALNALQSLDGVVVSMDALDVSLEGGNMMQQILYVWSVTFTANVGNVPLLQADSSNLVVSDAGQLKPFVDVIQVVAGTSGNNRAGLSDLGAIAISATQTYVDPGIQEVQSLQCTGTASFSLTFGGTTITVGASTSLAVFNTQLNALVTGGVLLTPMSPTSTVCHPYNGREIRVTFLVPQPNALLVWGNSNNMISIQRQRAGVASTTTAITIGNHAQQTLTCTGVTTSFDLVYGSSTVTVPTSTTPAGLASLLNAMPDIVALGGVTVTGSQATVCVATSPAPIGITFNAIGLASVLQVVNVRSGVSKVVVVETVRGLTSLVGVANGLYTATFFPTRKGIYALSVSIGGGTSLSPAKIQVVTGHANGPYCTHNARAAATQGIREAIVVQSRDAYLNTLEWSVPLSTQSYVASLIGASATIPVAVVEPVPNTDGTYQLSYVPQVAGNYVLSILYRQRGGLGATYFRDSRFLQAQLNPCPMTRLSNTDLSPCDMTRLDATIDFMWGETQPLGTSSPSFPGKTLALSGSASSRPNNGHLHDQRLCARQRDPTSPASGNYTTTVLLTKGTFSSVQIMYSAGATSQLTVAWASSTQSLAVIPSSAWAYQRHIDASPLNVVVYPGAINTSMSSASYAANSIVKALAPVTFDIATFDSAGNPRLNTGNDNLQVSLVGASGWAGVGRVNEVATNIPVQLTPSLLCPACVTALAADVITVNEDVLAQLLPGMGFRVIGANPGTATPALTTDCFFTVQSTTAFSLGSSTVTVAPSHGCSTFATSAFGLSSLVPETWRYLGTASVQHGAMALTATSADFRNVQSPLQRGDTIVVGREIHTVDTIFGTFGATTVPLAEAYNGLDGQLVPVYKAGARTGKYRVSFVPLVKGNYTLDAYVPPVSEVQTVTTASTSLLGGTFALTFSGLASGVLTNATTTPISYNADAAALTTALESCSNIPVGSVTVSPVVCISGNAALGCTWTITFSRSPTEGQLQLLTPVFASTLTGNAASVAVARLRVGVPIQRINGFPTTLVVQPGPTNPAVTTAFGSGLVQGTAGVPSTFSIQAKDTHGNNKEDLDPLENFQVDVYPAGVTYADSAHVSGTVVYAGSGLYNVTYTPLMSGTSTLAVAMSVLPEVQTLAISFPTAINRGGSYTLSSASATTISLAWDATGAQIQVALTAILDANVSVTTTPSNNGFLHTITFTEFVGDQVQLLVASDLHTGTATMATLQHGTMAHIKTSTNMGQPVANEVQVVRVDGGTGVVTGGAFALTWNGLTTPALAYNAPASAMQTALNGLLVDASVRVVVTSSIVSPQGTEWLVTFMATLPGAAQTMYWSSARYATQQYLVSTRMLGDMASLTATVTTPLTGGTPASVGVYAAALASPNGNIPVQGTSPFAPRIVSGVLVAAQTTATSSAVPFWPGTLNTAGLNGLVTGAFSTPSTFRIQPRDVYGNLITHHNPMREVQIVETMIANGDGLGALEGTFTLTYKGATTTALSWKAGIATVQAALNALPTIGLVDVGTTCATTFLRTVSATHLSQTITTSVSLVGTVSVGDWVRLRSVSGPVYTVAQVTATSVLLSSPYSGPTSETTDLYVHSLMGYAYVVTFDSNLGDVPAIAADSSALSTSNGVGTASIVVTACTANYTQQLQTTATSPIGGTFFISFHGARTPDLPFSISSTALTSALQQLPDIYAVKVSSPVSGANNGFTWIITLLAIDGNLDLLYAEGHLLTGARVSVLVTPTCPSSVQGATASQYGQLGEYFVPRLRGGATVTGYATYASPGQYLATYTTPRTGTYKLDVVHAYPNGLVGSYYNNRWLLGDPVLERIDADVNFYWDTFITPTGQDYVSVRWTGYLQPAFSEPYTFSVQVDDGARLWVNHVLVLDAYDIDVSAMTTYISNATALVAGRLYDIVLEYRENTGAAACILSWSSPSQDWSVVPSERLFYPDAHIKESPFAVAPYGILPTPPLSPMLSIAGAQSLLVTFSPPANDGGAVVDQYRVEWWPPSPTGVLAQQTLKLAAAVTGGSFTLGNGVQTTGPLAWNALYSDVAAALEALPGVGQVAVSYTKVTGQASTYTITFMTQFGAVAPLVVDGTLLLGSTAAAICAGASTTATGNPAGVLTCAISDSVVGTMPVPLSSTDVSLVVSPFAPYTFTITGLVQVAAVTAPAFPGDGGATGGFNVRVSAHTSAGYGLPSVVTTLKPMAVPSAPTSVVLNLVAGSSSSLRVFWRPPATINGAIVTSYLVEWDVAANFSVQNASFTQTPASFLAEYPSSTMFKHTISSLTPGTLYYVRVRAINIMGSSVPVGAPLSAIPMTKADAIPIAGGVTLSAVMADGFHSVQDACSTLQLAWLPSSNTKGSEVTKYLLEWYQAASPGIPEVQIISIFDTNSVAVTGSFQITYDQQTTDFLPISASAAAMAASLSSLNNLRSIQVVRSPSTSGGYAWTITFLTEYPRGKVLSIPLTHDLQSPDLVIDIGANLEPARVGATSINVDVVQNSAVVTSVGIQTSASIGQGISIAGVVYLVASVQTDQVTLTVPYAGATATGLAAAIGYTTPGMPPQSLQSIEVSAAAPPPLNYLLTNLAPGTSYVAQVSVYNGQGYGDPTASTAVYPPQQAPDVPLNVRVAPVAASTLVVYWNQPASSGGNAITKYRIEWDTSPAFTGGADGGALGYDVSAVVLPGVDCLLSPCQMGIGSLVKGTPYYVRVYAYNAYGYSDNAGLPTPAATVPMSFPSPPTTIVLGGGANHSITVNFSTLHDNGGAPVTRYKVEWDCMSQEAVDATPGLATSSLLYMTRAVQSIVVSASAFNLNGQFRLSFANHVTPWLAYSVSANDLQAALQALDPIGVVAVSRSTVGNGFQWLVTFLTNRENAQRNGDIPLLLGSIDASDTHVNFAASKTAVATSLLTGTNAQLTITTSISAYNGYDQQTLVLSTNAGALQGSFTLTFNGQTTVALPVDASAAAVQNALLGLGNTGDLWVSRYAGGLGYQWIVVFLTQLGSQPVLSPSTNELSSTDPAATISFQVLTKPGALPTMSSALYGYAIVPIAQGQSVVSYSIGNVRRSASYFVRVSAWNGFQNAFGAPMYATPPVLTVASTPDAPINVVVEPTSNTSLLVSWTPPLDTGGIPISSYIVDVDTTPGAPEVQRIVLSGTSALAGTFSLSFKSYGTAALSWNSTGDMVADALNALPTVQGAIVTRAPSGVFGTTWTVTFNGTSGNLPLLVASAAGLQGADVGLTVTEVTPGSFAPFVTKTTTVVRPVREIQSVFAYAGNADLGGYFNLVFCGQTTVNIPITASSSVVAQALQGLTSISTVSVTSETVVSDATSTRPQYGTKWLVTFSASDGNVPLLLVTTTPGLVPRSLACGGSLSGTTPCVATRSVAAGGLPSSVTLPGVVDSRAYFVQLRTVTAFGTSTPFVYPFSIAPQLVPPLPVPAAIASILSDTQISVSWTAPLDASVVNYKVQWDTGVSFGMGSPTSGSTSVPAVAGQRKYVYVISGVAASSQYYVRVLATNAAGFSAPTSAVPTYANDRVTRLVVSNTNINAILATPQTFTLGFANFPTVISAAVPFNAGASQIQTALQALAPVGTVFVTRSDHSSGPTGTTLDMSGVNTAAFRVEWFITFASSSVSNVAPSALGPLVITVSAGTLANSDFTATDIIPGVYPLPMWIQPSLRRSDLPRQVMATVVSSTSLGVQWQPPQYVASVTKYLVEWDTTYQFLNCIQSGASFDTVHSTVAVVTAPTTSYQINGLTTGTTYYVRVSAYNGQLAASNKGYSGAVVAANVPIVPSIQIPYLPQSVAVYVSPVNIPSQLNVVFMEPTVNALGFLEGNGGAVITEYEVDVASNVQFNGPTRYPMSMYKADGTVQSCALTPCSYPLGAEVQTISISATSGSYRLVYDADYSTLLCAACTITITGTQIAYNGPDLRPMLGANVRFIVDKLGAACVFVVAATATPTANAVSVVAGASCSLTTGTYSMHAKPTTSCVDATADAATLEDAIMTLTNIDVVTVSSQPGTAVGTTQLRVTFIGPLVAGNVPQLLPVAYDGSGGCTALAGGNVWTSTLIDGGFLTSGAPYYVRVAATNSAGTSPAQVAAPTQCPGGCSIDGSIHPGSKPPPPASVLVFANAADRTSLRLTWAPPTTTNGAPILSYVIEYSTMAFATSDVCGGCVTALSGVTLTMNAQVTLTAGTMFELTTTASPPCLMIVNTAQIWNAGTSTGTMTVQPNHGCTGFTASSIFMSLVNAAGGGYTIVPSSSLTDPFSSLITIVPNTAYTLRMRSWSVFGIGPPAMATPTCDATLIACTASPGSNAIVSRQLPAQPTLILPMQLVSGVGNGNGFSSTSLVIAVRDSAYWHGAEAISSFLVEWDLTSTFSSPAVSSVTVIPSGPTSLSSSTAICPSCATSLQANVLTLSGGFCRSSRRRSAADSRRWQS
ncbi:hypothetical protein SPRG_04153 [Saprolegnia parasitica CBS 223.65]|uniref:Titin n=1 Tax=Saprolegnia parasitica (strain CBS 223.65) TaxID=695850 RepID=A0A067CNY2_SAPPC|nr:hypothetical protein SPRG_04153 [Saprolegnia parasitica CBS 223.65]KDO30965.1 hypothetical protein SPRG_04153 [Saprolegnia parasitica CBS 223.65]|eukprot:XP_012198149.1 hypothetical protein SPRG_04153 [Saprolegnia parasitica CBS 223.65]